MINKLNPIIFAGPALLDTIASFLSFTGLALISASTYQILKMLSMVFVVFLSIIALGKRYNLAQYLALLAITFGLTVVTLTDIYAAEHNN